MRDVTELNIKQLNVCLSMCEHGVNMHLYKAVILTFSILFIIIIIYQYIKLLNSQVNLE